VYGEEGWEGLYRGIGTKLWHSAMISALMFLVYERVQASPARDRA
jgi:hypothetical protein